MITTLLFDFSYVLLFPKERSYTDELSNLFDSLKGVRRDDLLDQFVLNEELLSFLTGLKSDYSLYIFTASTIYNKLNIRRRLDEVFEDIFSTVERGMSKSDPSSYTRLAQQLGKDPREIVLIDDTQSNVAAARAAGLKVIQYESNEQTIAALQKLLVAS